MNYLLIFLFTFASYAEDFSTDEFAIVNEVINYAKEHSIKKDIDDEDITSGMLKGALAEIDSHSTYYTEGEYKKLQESLDGSFSGIGVYIDIKDGVIHVRGVIKGMPAEKSGVQNGDYITHIDNKSTFGMSLDEASSMLRGKKKTKVNVKLLREGQAEPVQVCIIRSNIAVDTVTLKKLGDILLLEIGYFNENTYVEFLKILKKQRNYKGIILDLRSNPGGVLDGAIGISSLFLEKDQVIVQVSNVADMQKYNEKSCIGVKKYCRNILYQIEGDRISIVNKHSPLISNAIPIVILVNTYSASASEIVSLALQQNNRGIVMGQKTFGKGSVQSVVPLQEGKRGALKLTTALYYSPNGSSIQAIGVNPDIILPDFQIKKSEKNSVFFPDSESIYKKHIKVNDNILNKNNTVFSSDLEDFAIQSAISSLRILMMKQ